MPQRAYKLRAFWRVCFLHRLSMRMQPPAPNRIQDARPRMVELAMLRGWASCRGTEWLSALRGHLGTENLHWEWLQMATCNRKTKIAAFANDSEKLIMPPRSSFGRYLQWCQFCKQNVVCGNLNSIVLGPATHIVLNLASEGKINPTHAWKMQNSITNVPISCSKDKCYGWQDPSVK